MKIDGNLTITGGGRLDNSQYDKDIYLLGDWIDNNIGAVGFVPGNGTVFFSDSTKVQHVILAADSVTEPFYNFAIDNAYGVVLSKGSVAVGNQLILTLGNISTSDINSLTITYTGTDAVVGGGIASFVNGPLRKQIASGSSFRFPVGDAVSSGRNRFGYASVSNTSTSGTQTWTAQFFDKNPTADGYDISSITPPVNLVVYNGTGKSAAPAEVRPT